RMSPDAVSVKYLDRYRLKVQFEDGRTGIADFAEMVADGKGVMKPLRNVGYFKRVRVEPESGTLVWPNGVDVCPDVLYWLATGTPITWATETRYHRPPVQLQRTSRKTGQGRRRHAIRAR